MTLEQEIDFISRRSIDHPNLKYLNKKSYTYKIIKGWNVKSDADIEQIGEKILQELGIKTKLRWKSSPNGDSAINPYGIGSWVVAQSRKRKPHQVLSELKALFEKNEVIFYEYVAIWGLSIRKQIELDLEGIKIVPISKIPSSGYKDALTGVMLTRFPIEHTIPSLKPSATAVVIKKMKVNPIFFEEGKIFKTTFVSSVDRILEMVKVMVVVFGVPIVTIAQWTEVHENTPYLLAGSGGANMTYPFLGYFPKQCVIRSEELKKYINAYLSMTEEFKQKIDIPLSRLNSALAHYLYPQDKHDTIEAAVDLGIAMEAFLFDENENHTAKTFALRGSLWLGKNKKNTNMQLKKFYDRIRSKAVHTGGLKKNLSNKDKIELFENTFKLFILMLRKTIVTGVLPDWEMVELNIK